MPLSRSIVCTFIYFISLSCFAQNSSLLFEKVKLPDEIAEMVIGKMIRDRTGYAWITTENGLIRYNGYDFKVYRHIGGDSTSLPGNHISDIVEADNHKLYVATRNGLCVYDAGSERFTTYHHREGDATSLPSDLLVCL